MPGRGTAEHRRADVRKHNIGGGGQKSGASLPDTAPLSSFNANRDFACQLVRALKIVWRLSKSERLAVDGALAERKRLAVAAAADKGRYIRPITLFQAQPATAGADVTVDVLKAHLLALGVPERAIAVATGDTRGLDGIDLMKPDCPVEHVITVQALKEGWDCSFAYVFCSLANVGSEGAVEQLLGRVLRQPYAERRADPSLNQAHAHVSSPVFAATAEKLKDQLVAMGFNAPGEARSMIVEQATVPLEGGGINRVAEPLALWLDAPLDVSALPVAAQRAVRLESRADGSAVLHIAADTTPAVASVIAAIVEKSEARGKAKAGAILDWQAVNDMRRAPAGRGVTFARVPQFMVRVQGALELAEPETFINLAGWRLEDASHELDAAAFDYDETAQVFRFDLDGEALSYTLAARTAELALDYAATWTPHGLASWLAANIDKRDRWHSSHSAVLEFARRAVDDLLTRRTLPLATLARGRYVLKRAIEGRIRASRLAAAERGRDTLFGLPDDLVVAPDHAFAFDPAINPASNFYEGAWTPNKHYYARMGTMNPDELECAQTLDDLPAVASWIRNGDYGAHVFSLPTSTGRFLPDFIAELSGGRVFVLEHKGAHLEQYASEREKDLIGQHWAARSGGRCLFAMVTQRKSGASLRRQIEAELS